MLDEKDLQAISDLMDLKLAQQKQEILDESTQRMNIIVENHVQTQLNLLAEQQTLILEKLTPQETISDLEDRVSMLEFTTKALATDVRKLKTAT